MGFSEDNRLRESACLPPFPSDSWTGVLETGEGLMQPR